jgi:hypothetical protein
MKSIAFLRALSIAFCLCASVPAMAQQKSATEEGFVLKPGTARIVLMRPRISVGAQSTGGIDEPNADWTAQARDNIAEALRQAQAQLGNSVSFYSEGASGDGPIVTQYSKLFTAVADSAVEYQFFVGNRLPTKKHSKGFEWGIGDGLSRLKTLEGADYALFITTHDAYGSTGRKVLQIAGLLGGIPITSGVHKGEAGLVDLKTGELVWLNADLEMGGDVRTADGAQKRVRELLKGFPGKPDEIESAK